MEVLLEAASGVPPDAVVSLRLGPTRRQAPLRSALSHPLRFTTPLDDACEPLRVDVMRPLASARLVLRPEELRYSLPLTADMAVRLKVKPAKVAERERGWTKMDRFQGEPGEKLSAGLKDVTAGARDYLEHHKLLQYMQAMLHAVIQAKPLDPFSFMISQLAAARRPRGRPRRSNYPNRSAKEDVADAHQELELSSDPGPLPPSTVPSSTPAMFSDPGCEKVAGAHGGGGYPPEAKDPVQGERLKAVRGNLRKQLAEAVEEGKLVSAVERAVSLMAGQEDDEVRLRTELAQLKEDQVELRQRSERLTLDLRELREVNLSLRHQLAHLTASKDRCTMAN